jgi:hypothetical protein
VARRVVWVVRWWLVARRVLGLAVGIVPDDILGFEVVVLVVVLGVLTRVRQRVLLVVGLFPAVGHERPSTTCLGPPFLRTVLTDEILITPRTSIGLGWD